MAEARRESSGGLVKILLDFKPGEQDPKDVVRGWKGLAMACGFSVKTLQRACWAFGVDLPRWGAQGGSAPVYLPKGKLSVLRQLVFNRLH